MHQNAVTLSADDSKIIDNCQGSLLPFLTITHIKRDR